MIRITISGTLIAILLAIYSIPLKADESIGGGNVSGLWTKANSIYQVSGNITIDAGDTLTIEPGVKVEFMGHFGIEIDGVLLAIGTAGDTIWFTKTDTLGLADYTTTDGSWAGIRFMEGSAGTMSHCKVEFANPYDGGYAGDPVNVNDADLYLSNSVFRHNYGSVGALRFWQTGRSEIKNNLFIHNTGFNQAGALEIGSNDYYLVEGNYFIRNKGHSGGAITVPE